MSKNPIVSIIVLNLNGKEFLTRCFNSLKKLNFPYRYEIIVVDNASTDGSQEFIKKNFPFVKLIENKVNAGYAGGNVIGAKESKGKYIVFLNNDTQVDKNWLINLVKVAKSDEKIGLCSPKQLMGDKKTLLYGGSAINYLGFAYLPHIFEKDTKDKKTKETLFASGASLLIKREVMNKIGLFDEDYIIYHEDVDLSWRAALAGYKIMYVPTSFLYHFYTPRRNPKKMYLLEKNRFMTIFKNYSFKTIILILPILLFFDVLILLYSLARGWFSLKIKSYFYFLLNIKNIIKKRVKIQKLRKVSDKEILKNFTQEIYFAEESKKINKIASRLLKFYWLIIKDFI